MKNNATINCLTLGGGLVAVLLCASACGPANPPYDSGIPGPDSGPPTDGGMDLPDSYVPPDTDGGMPDLDSGMPDVDTGTADAGLVCTSDMIASRTPGCGALYDLPVGMSYDDTAMIPACATTLNGTTWANTGRTCHVVLFRETGSDQWLLRFSCDNANDLPYDGLYRLGSDGAWHANEGNAALPGGPGYHGRLVSPSSDCRSLTGSFFRGGETTQYRSGNYWIM